MGKNGTKKEQKKLSYKIAKKGTGGIVVKGLSDAEQDVLSDILIPYGFVVDSKGCWIDEAAPVDDVIEESLSTLKKVAPFNLRTEISQRGNVRYFVRIDESKEAADADIHAAFDKAYRVWNRDGRPVKGVRVTSVLDRAVEQIQSRRV